MNRLEIAPELAEDVQVRFLKEDERGKFYIVGRKGKSSFLRVHQVGKDIIEMLDGARSVAQIEEVLKKRKIEVDLYRFIALLGEEGLLKNLRPKKQKEKEKLTVWYFPLIKRTDRILNKVYHILSGLFRREVLWLLTTFNLAVLLIFLLELISGRMGLQDLLLFRSSQFLVIIASLFLAMPFLVLAHELAHAATCFHYGGRPGEMGVAFYLFLPFFYVDTSDTWMLEERQGIMVFLAGPLLTFSVGSACFLLYFILPSFFGAFLLSMVFWSYMVTFIGFNPTFEADGYYILQSMLKFPNLSSHVWKYTSLWLKHRLFFQSKEKYEDYISDYSKQERRILAIYAPLVLLANAVLICFMSVWGFHLIIEYSNLTRLLVETFPNVATSAFTTWVVQSVSIALLLIVFPYTFVRKVINARKPKNQLATSNETT